MKTNKICTTILGVMLASVLALATVNMTGCSKSSTGDRSSTKGTYDKVLASGTIRCGYVPYPPGLIKDPNTGKISGIFPEILEEAAKNLGFKVVWAEEVGWGTMVEGLQNSRYDIIGSPVWPLSTRARVADFTEALYYGGAEAYVRNDDHRFDSDITVLNDAKFKIATIDGEVTEQIAQNDFPKANRVSQPQSTDISLLLLSVADGKADVTFAEPHVAYEFIKKNPGKIRAAQPGNPLRLYPNTLMLKQEDVVLRRVIDNAIAELQNNGYVERVLLKYEPFPGAFYRNAKPIAKVAK